MTIENLLSFPIMMHQHATEHPHICIKTPLINDPDIQLLVPSLQSSLSSRITKQSHVQNPLCQLHLQQDSTNGIVSGPPSQPIHYMASIWPQPDTTTAATSPAKHVGMLTSCSTHSNWKEHLVHPMLNGIIGLTNLWKGSPC